MWIRFIGELFPLRMTHFSLLARGSLIFVHLIFFFFLGGLSLSHTNLNRIPFRDEHITGNGKQPWGVWEGVCAQLDARHTDHHEVRSSAIWYLVNEEIDTRYT